MNAVDFRVAVFTVILLVCFLARKRAIGGWLLFYLISMMFSMAIWTAITIPSLSFLHPSAWPDRGKYLMFLLTALPNDILFLLQFTVSMMLIARRFREGMYVDILRILLLSQVIFTLVIFPVHKIYAPESALYDLLGIIAPTIWLLYFTFSRRVRSVYKEKDWDLKTT